MQYLSTRSQISPTSFSDVLLSGLSPDGGLFMPQSWPKMDAQAQAKLAQMPFAELAAHLLSHYVGDAFSIETLRKVCQQSYSTFAHPQVCPLKQLEENLYILELFHGPTLAFKDVAMQVLARLMSHELQKQNKRAAIVGATSGDTGSAAIEAFKGMPNVDIFILFPKGKVSPFQQRQMTTHGQANVHAIALEGTFDDAQALVKAMFADKSFAQKVSLSGVNSINWARIAAQVSYFAYSALQLGFGADYVVPTGNFGDIFAGYVAKQMGFDIGELVIATNQNDILYRTLATGVYDIQGVEATSSPSMDIQVSSNFERLLYCATNKNTQAVAHFMQTLKEEGKFTLDEQTLTHIKRDFSAQRASEEDVRQAIQATWQNHKYLIDPHTAVGLVAAQRRKTDKPQVVLSTAHSAKFANAVQNAVGFAPQTPEHLAHLFEKKETYSTVPVSLQSVQNFILERCPLS